MIERKDIKKSVKLMVKGADKLDFSIAIQRNEVWDLERKSLFIHSLIYGYPINPIYVSEGADGKLQVLDGKQRLTTIIKFVNGQFSLSENTPAIVVGGQALEIQGKDYDSLGSCKIKEEGKKEKDFVTLKDLLDDYSIYLTELKDITADERDEFFLRTNSGMALTSFELARCLAKEGVMGFIKEITDTPFYQHAAFTDKGRNRFVDQESVLQSIALLMGKPIDFSGKSLKTFASELHDEYKGVPEGTMTTLKSVIDYLGQAFPEKESFLRKVHIPMLVMTTLEAQDKGVTPKQFNEWAKVFFKVMHSTSVYGRAAGQGSAKKDNVIKRLNEMSKHFNKHVEMLKGQTAEQGEQGEQAEQEVAEQTA